MGFQHHPAAKRTASGICAIGIGSRIPICAGEVV
jgi:hypothetical protein